MFSLTSSHRFLLYREPTDMRKSFDALCGIVRSELHRDPLCAEVFVFLNRGRTHIKLLHWESGGLVLYYKRLEQGTFAPPSKTSPDHTISWADLVLLTEGITVHKSTRKKRWNNAVNVDK
ncbi:MAG: transposase [Sphingobacteriales bacterium]|nr:MAG: transposase [Sphingobacteriales bacterium]